MPSAARLWASGSAGVRDVEQCRVCEEKEDKYICVCVCVWLGFCSAVYSIFCVLSTCTHTHTHTTPACKKTLAGGAYSVNTAAAATVRGTVRRLREAREIK
jgi:hypothetical protein